MAAAGGIPALAAVTDAIVERLRVAVTLTAPSGWTPGALPDTPPAGTLRQRVLGPLQGNLTWQSAAFRHGLRTAVVAGPALALTLSLPGHYQHWLTITLILTMQPFYALTWQRALERIGGTVLGGVLAAGIALLCTSPLQIAAALFPLAVAAFTVRAVNFGAFMALLTPLVVLLTEFSRPGSGEWLIAFYRAGYTAAGGLLAVAGCLILWPSWEPDRLRRELEAAIAAHASFAEAEMNVLLGEGDAEAVEQARRAAGVASNNLETSLSRALNEPRRNQREALQSAMVIDAALRRMAGRLSALQLRPAPRRHAERRRIAALAGLDLHGPSPPGQGRARARSTPQPATRRTPCYASRARSNCWMAAPRLRFRARLRQPSAPDLGSRAAFPWRSREVTQ